MLISSYNMGIAFSSYYFCIEKYILKIKLYRGNDNLFTILKCVILSLGNIWKYMRVINKIYIEIKEYLKH